MAVLVFTENWDGKFKKLSFELISYASEIAKNINSNVVALSIGEVPNEELEKLGAYGAQKILTAKSDLLNQLDNMAYSSVIAEAAEKEGAQIVVFAHNNTGKALAPRVAVKLKAGLVSGVTGLPSDFDNFTITKGVFNSKAYANVKVHSGSKVLSLMQNSFTVIESENNAEVVEFIPALSDDQVKTKVKDVNKITGKILLNDAEIVVSGGRGMKSPDNFGPFEEFAEILGAATACSRPVSDEGWRPHAEHTGQTGKIIAPNLYFALGISGMTRVLPPASSTIISTTL